MNHVLPSWIAHLLGIDLSSGEGAVWNLEYAWPWPSWLTLLFVLCTGAFIAAIYLRESPRCPRWHRLGLAGMRFALAMIVLLMISQFTLTLRRTGLPYLAVLVDDSLSMTTIDPQEKLPQANMAERISKVESDSKDLSRWGLAQTLLNEHHAAMLRQLADEYRLRLFLLTGVREVEPHGPDAMEKMSEELQAMKPTGEASPLGRSVRTVLDHLRGTAPAAIVMLTDGVNTEGPSLSEAAKDAARRGVPLFFIGLGSEHARAEVKLSDLLVDEVVFVNDMVRFECRTTVNGVEGRKFNLILREKGKPEELAKVEMTAGPDNSSQPAQLLYRPTQVGRFDYVVSVEPQDQEAAVQTNELSRNVEVRKEKVRVLLVQGTPNFEYRYLRNMFQRDETIELTSVLQEADRNEVAQEASKASVLQALPSRREEWFAYDVIIFGDVDPSLLNPTALQNLADFVDQPGKGGAIVFIAGPKFMPAAYRDTPLARLFPFDPNKSHSPESGKTIADGFQIVPTELGLASPAMQMGDSLEQTREIWRHLQPEYWLLEIPSVKPSVRVLAEASNRTSNDGRRLPVICLHYIGAGKVLFHASDETWRWRYRVGDLYFARYWIQTIRFLSRSLLSEAGRPVTLSSDRREYAYDEPIRLRSQFADERLAPAEDDGVSVVIERSGQPSQRMVLHRTTLGRGVFEGVLNRLGAGSYHAWIASPSLQGQAPTVEFSVLPPVGELTQLRMDATEMRRAAQQTGGQFYTFETADQLYKDLPPGRQVPIELLPPHPLWNSWPVLSLFFILLIGEWLLRKQQGMT
jgi:hypothetical protein